MTSPHRFSRLVFAAAGLYVLLTVTPLYWMEASIARDAAPGITHPESYYDFIGVTVAWQLAWGALFAASYLLTKPGNAYR